MTLSQVKLPERPSFAGILENGIPIFNGNLDDLIQVPGIEYIVKVEFVDYNLRKFTLIHNDGKLRFLKIGDFEVRDISVELYHLEHKVDVLIYDHIESQIRKVRIRTGQSASVMMRELLNVLKNLDEARSYSLYMKLNKLNELEQENIKLKDEIVQLKLQLKGV